MSIQDILKLLRNRLNFLSIQIKQAEDRGDIDAVQMYNQENEVTKNTISILEKIEVVE